MFRRRTDQVYATLQQVQRRITEQGGQTAYAPPPAPVRSATVGGGPARAPLAEALPEGPANAPSTAAAPAPTAPAPAGLGSFTAPVGAPASPFPTPVRRHGFAISGQLAITLAIIWLLSLAAAFFLGQLQGSRTATAGAGYAPGPAGERQPPLASADPPPAARRGDEILVLQEEPAATPEARARYQKEADRLNGIAPKAGGKPWFAVRLPVNGGIQLVYGQVDGQFGVNRRDVGDFAAKLSKFPHLKWLTLPPDGR